ncbi:MAG: DNA-3-methyladenine glycosylase I [Bryobacterales bacterium]|nr:DNA-3-methyladenine glycosylase I [Bryobacterales bacterium]
MQEARERCPWAKGSLYTMYHDTEWGVPSHDDRHLFEMLILEGAQAGLSWQTILNKRENYRRLFHNFDAERVASFDEARIAALLADAGIVRNRAKVHSAVGNARAFLEVQQQFGSFDAYLWPFVDGQPRQNEWHSLGEVPAVTAEAKALSKDLLQRGFKFVGPTICYAFMQAVGMVNDHITACFRWAEVRSVPQASGKA